MKAASDLLRDIDIAASLDIDSRYVNWICKAIRRDPRYKWDDNYLKELGVWGLEWDTVADEQIKELARNLARAR